MRDQGTEFWPFYKIFSLEPFGPVHEILVLSASVSRKDSVSTHLFKEPSLLAYTQSVDVDESSDQD